MSKNLFDDSDDELNEDNFQIKTNENYAKTYNSLRKKELLQKFKGKEMDAMESDSDDSDSSEEDEIVDPSFDQDFLNTLASLKSKDPAIYDKKTEFFKNVDSEEDSVKEVKNHTNKERKSKAVSLKDYERKIILEKGGKFLDDSDDDEEKDTVHRSISPSAVEEERRLKAELRKVVNDVEESEDEEFGGIFKKREKTKDEKDKEENEYLKWLAGKKEIIEENVKEKLEPLKNYWSNEKLPPSEKFLRDYVLNKGYTEARNYDEIPTYEEIIGDEAPLSEDERELEKQSEFEQKYNFRYEEPDQEFIKRYPRSIETSLRLTVDKRKKKRQEIKERKHQEKQQKLKELEIVKEVKRKEIQEKIEKLKMVTGNDELGFKDADLEDDFDPDAHDRRMQELFNDDYYKIDEGEQKPECPSEIEELKVQDWDNYNPQVEELYDYNELHCEDEDFNMDCDYDPAKAKEELQRDLIENTRKRKSGRKGRRDRFMEIIKSEKPVFDPQDEKTYGEYIDEYYKLDCEDIIGDTPCRFKYVETTPNDFGLSIEEILLAKNKELNQWASLKKAIQIRPDYVEKKDQRLYKLKAKNEELKRKIFKSLYGDGSDNENEDLEADQTKNQNAPETENLNENSTKGESRKAKKRRKRKFQNTTAGTVTKDEELNLNVNNNSINENNVQENTLENAKIDGVTLFSNNVTSDAKADLHKKKKKKKINSKIETQTTNEKIQKLENKAPDVKNIKHLFNKDPSNKSGNNVSKKIFSANKMATKTSLNDIKPVVKNNPFAKVPLQLSIKEGIGSLPPLRNNLSKLKKFNNKSNLKFKSKIEFKKSVNGSYKSASKVISDERLKAYGINPKKFHKKQKYENREQI